MEIAVGVLAASPAGEGENTAFGIAAIFAAVPLFFVPFIRFVVFTIRIFAASPAGKRADTAFGIPAVFTEIAILFLAIIGFMVFAMRIFAATAGC